MNDSVKIDWGSIPHWIKGIIVLFGLMGTGGGGTSMYNAVKQASQIEELQKQFKTLDENKADNKLVASYFIALSYDVCMLGASHDRTQQRSCAAERTKALQDLQRVD